MTNQEKIEAILKSGHKAVVYDTEEEEYTIVFRETDDLFLASYWEKSIDWCLRVGVWEKAKTYFNKLLFIISPYAEKPPVLKVGDKIQILEVAKECGNYEDWDKEKKDMVGTVGEIKEVIDNSQGVYYWIWNKDKSNWWNFPHYAVCLAVDEPAEEEPEETLEINGKKYKRSEVEERVKELKPIN